jgi:hypothetical protein
VRFAHELAKWHFGVLRPRFRTTVTTAQLQPARYHYRATTLLYLGALLSPSPQCLITKTGEPEQSRPPILSLSCYRDKRDRTAKEIANACSVM